MDDDTTQPLADASGYDGELPETNAQHNNSRHGLSIEDHSMTTVILLTISNIFMTFAWYGHLKYKQVPLITAILVSWLIAFIEYCFQVPANRIGHLNFESAQLKVMQEVITLVVFGVFSVTYLKEPLRWNYVVGFVLMVAAVVFFVFAIPPRNPPVQNTPAAAANDTPA